MTEYIKYSIYVKTKDIPTFEKFVQEYKTNRHAMDFYLYERTVDAMQGTVKDSYYQYSMRDFKRMYHILKSWLSEV